MTKINAPLNANHGYRASANLETAKTQAEMLTRATYLKVPTDSIILGGATLPVSPSKKDLAAMFRGQSPEQLAAMKKLYLERNGVSLDQVIESRFDDEDRVELQALSTHGKLRDSDALESALQDDQNNQIHRLLKRRTGRELQEMRSEYHQTYGKDLDKEVLNGLSGKDRELAKVLLEGEPERGRDESDASLAKRKGDYIARQLEISTRLELTLYGPLPPNGKRILDALHDHSPEALREAERQYKERTGRDLRETLKDQLTGANEDIALAYLDDGKETPIEKLRRAFDGDNDEELIRRTLSHLTPEQRKELTGSHGVEVAKLFTELNDEETVEMKALLAKGKLDNADRLAVAVADGKDKGIMKAMKSLSAEERQALARDPGRLAATLDALDSNEAEEVQRLLKTGRMSAAGQLRHAETAEEAYQAAAYAKESGETAGLEFVGTVLAPKSGAKFSLDRFKAHLEKGQLSPEERIALENDEDRMKATLRGMSAEELKRVAGSPKAMEQLDDELGKKSMAEAKELLARGPLSVHESMRHAVAQDDEKRVKELLAGLKDDKQKSELLEKYRSSGRSELLNDLRDILGSDDLRHAENALRLQAADGDQVGRRVRDDMFADRDDNGVGSVVSNGLLDTFSSAGKNMDDQAREAEALVRSHKREGGVTLGELQNKEAAFQDSREQMHVERQKIADIAISAVSALVTAGLGGLTISGGLVGQLLRASWAARGVAVAGGVGARWGAEALFRGNDFGTAQDFRKSGISAAWDSVTAISGGILGKAAGAGQSSITGSVVKDAWSGALGTIPKLEISDAPLATMGLGILTGGVGGGSSSWLSSSIRNKILKEVVSAGSGLGVTEASSALQGTLLNEVR